MKSEIVMGIPKNTKLRQDLEPLLQDSLGLDRVMPGVFKSPSLPGVKIVEMRTADIVTCLREKMMQIGLISDEIGAEDLLNPDRPRFGERQFGIPIADPPRLEFLTTRERALNPALDRNAYLGLRVGVTSFPNLMRSALSDRARLAVPAALAPDRILTVDGQVESFMRSGLIGNPSLALELVRSGKTARDFGLVRVGEPLLTALPSVWKARTFEADRDAGIDGVIESLRARLETAFGIDLAQSLR